MTHAREIRPRTTPAALHAAHAAASPRRAHTCSAPASAAAADAFAALPSTKLFTYGCAPGTAAAAAAAAAATATASRQRNIPGERRIPADASRDRDSGKFACLQTNTLLKFRTALTWQLWKRRPNGVWAQAT